MLVLNYIIIYPLGVCKIICFLLKKIVTEALLPPVTNCLNDDGVLPTRRASLGIKLSRHVDGRTSPFELLHDGYLGAISHVRYLEAIAHFLQLSFDRPLRHGRTVHSVRS